MKLAQGDIAIPRSTGVFVFTSAKGSERVFELGLPRRAAQSIIATVTEAERERERDYNALASQQV